MKNLFCLLAAAGLLFLYGCNENNEPEIKTGFSLGRNIVEMPPEGGSATVVWVVENPVDGISVEIGDGHPEWVNGFDISEFGKIHFNVDSTDIEVDSRECEVSVTYGETSQTFRVIQAGADPAIDFQLVSVSPTGVIVSVEPKDENMNKWVNIVEKNVWEAYGSDEALFNADMEIFKKYAEMSGITVEQWMSINFDMLWALSPYYLMSDVVTSSGNGAEPLRPDTEYVTYTYGINGQGDILSRVYSIECATEAFDLSNPTTFDMKISVEGTYVSAEINPSDQNQRYHAGIYMAADGIPSEEELILELQSAAYGSIFMGWSHPDNTLEWSAFVESGFPTGKRTVAQETQLAGRKGLIFAYAVDDRGIISGRPRIEEFSTEDIPMSDNQIAMEVSDIDRSSATLTITTTNNDLYNVTFAPFSSEYDGLEGEELVRAVAADGQSVVNGGSGNAVKKLTELQRTTEYIIVAYGFDKGKFTTDPFTCRFTTATPDIADATCTPVAGKYFDAAEAYTKYPEHFGHLKDVDCAVVPVEVEVSADAEWFSYHAMSSSFVRTQSDDDIIKILENVYNNTGPLGKEKIFDLVYDNPITFIAVARDAEGKYGEVYRSEEIVFTKDGVSPIDELVIE